MKIALIASEVTPFAKTGGLATFLGTFPWLCNVSVTSFA